MIGIRQACDLKGSTTAGLVLSRGEASSALPGHRDGAKRGALHEVFAGSRSIRSPRGTCPCPNRRAAAARPRTAFPACQSQSRVPTARKNPWKIASLPWNEIAAANVPSTSSIRLFRSSRSGFGRPGLCWTGDPMRVRSTKVLPGNPLHRRRGRSPAVICRPVSETAGCRVEARHPLPVGRQFAFQCVSDRNQAQPKHIKSDRRFADVIRPTGDGNGRARDPPG